MVFQKAIRSLRQTNYEYDDEDSKEEQTKRLYADKLSVYYAILHLIAIIEGQNMARRRRIVCQSGPWILKN